MGKTLITAVLLWCNLYIRISHMTSLEKNCFISCGRLKNVPQEIYIIPGTCECYLTWQKDWQMCSKLGILRWANYRGRTNVITRVLIRQRQEGES